MSISKQGESLFFDQALPTTSGVITGVIMCLVTVSNVNVGVDPIFPAVPALSQEDVPVAGHVHVEDDVPEQGIVPTIPDPNPTVPAIRRDINATHNLMGHAHFDAIKRSAKYYGIKLSGEPKICVSMPLLKSARRISIK
jgi:hypothetical protein